MLGSTDEVSRIQIGAKHADTQEDMHGEEQKLIDTVHVGTDHRSGEGVKNPAPVDRADNDKPELSNTMEGNGVPLPTPTGEDIDGEDSVDTTGTACRDGRVLSLEAKRGTDEGMVMAKAFSRKLKIGLVEVESELRGREGRYMEHREEPPRIDADVIRQRRTVSNCGLAFLQCTHRLCAQLCRMAVQLALDGCAKCDRILEVAEQSG